MTDQQSTVLLSLVRIDGGTQPRVAISEATVNDYAELMHSDTALPPVDVFFDGVDYWLADGFHRYHAAQRLGLEYLRALVRNGTRRDAVLFSVGANYGHGLQRTNEDKRRAVTTLLDDEEWSHWSNKEIARRCGVNPSLVDKMRNELPTVKRQVDGDQQRKWVTRHGTEATMNVGEIGKKRVVADPPLGEPVEAPKFKSRAAVEDRRRIMRDMASNAHTTRQIAAAVGMTEMSCRAALKANGIDVPADRVAGGFMRHDSIRIMECIVSDAESLTADINLIDFDDIPAGLLSEWIASLNRSKKALESFIRQLVKESQKHGEAA